MTTFHFLNLSILFAVFTLLALCHETERMI
jgi:hypothetical protein